MNNSNKILIGFLCCYISFITATYLNQEIDMNVYLLSCIILLALSVIVHMFILIFYRIIHLVPSCISRIPCPVLRKIKVLTKWIKKDQKRKISPINLDAVEKIINESVDIYDMRTRYHEALKAENKKTKKNIIDLINDILRYFN
jgi:hypothetical protein